jgi:hypothetical protein
MRHDWTSEEQTYTRNLLRVFSLASIADIKGGKLWYPRARSFAARLAHKHGVSAETSAGVISALSPGCAWDRNKRSADEFLFHARKHGADCLNRTDLSTYGRRPLAKAWRIFNGKDPDSVLATGHKTHAFYHAIIDPKQTALVVIDSHAKSAAHGVRVGIGPVKLSDAKYVHKIRVHNFEYAHLQRAFLEASARVGLLPNQFQATVWLTWRKLPSGFQLNNNQQQEYGDVREYQDVYRSSGSMARTWNGDGEVQHVV